MAKWSSFAGINGLGSLLWMFPTYGQECHLDLAVDSMIYDGNDFVFGVFLARGTGNDGTCATVDTVPVGITGGGSGNGNDLLIVKRNATTGQRIWTKGQFTGNTSCQVQSTAYSHADNTLVLGGYTQKLLPGNIKGQGNRAGTSQVSGCVLKINAHDGQLIWAKHIDGVAAPSSGYDFTYIHGLTIDPSNYDGDIYVSGFSGSVIGGTNGCGDQNLTNVQEGYMVRLKKNGERMWVRSVPASKPTWSTSTSPIYTTIYDLVIGRAGNLYAIGVSTGDVGSIHLPLNSESTMMVVKQKNVFDNMLTCPSSLPPYNAYDGTFFRTYYVGSDNCNKNDASLVQSASVSSTCSTMIDQGEEINVIGSCDPIHKHLIVYKYPKASKNCQGAYTSVTKIDQEDLDRSPTPCTGPGCVNRVGIPTTLYIRNGLCQNLTQPTRQISLTVECLIPGEGMSPSPSADNNNDGTSPSPSLNNNKEKGNDGSANNNKEKTKEGDEDSNIAIIIGGVVGGLFIMTFFVVLLVKVRAKSTANLENEAPGIELFGGDSLNQTNPMNRLDDFKTIEVVETIDIK